MTNTLAYQGVELITAIKSSLIHGDTGISFFFVVTNGGAK
jgi:hypothetical protein